MPVFQAMSRPELLKVLAAETSQRDGDTDDSTANFAAQVQALHNNAPAGNDSDSDESACNADQDDLEFDAMVLEDMDPEDRREFEQVQKTIEKHQARAKQKEWAVVRKAMMPKAKAKAKAKAKTKAKSKAKTKAKAKASNKANIIKGLKTAKSSSSKVASKASRKIWHGALKKKRQDCPALREGDTHEKGNVLVEVPEEVEAVTPNPWQRRVVRRTHSVSSCPESARPAAQAEAAPEERPASVAEDNSTAPPEDKPASVADDGNRLSPQADLPPASHTQSPSKSTRHSDEPLPSSGASVIAASSSADDLAMADGAGAQSSRPGHHGPRQPAVFDPLIWTEVSCNTCRKQCGHYKFHPAPGGRDKPTWIMRCYDWEKGGQIIMTILCVCVRNNSLEVLVLCCGGALPGEWPSKGQLRRTSTIMTELQVKDWIQSSKTCGCRQKA